MSQLKVFEFAKEMGIETISLMDKIKKWDLPVKSHMSTLDDAVIDEIKARFNEEAEAKSSKKATKKKKVAKKKATKKAATKKATKKKVTKKAGAVTKKKTTTVKKATTKKTVAKDLEKTEEIKAKAKAKAKVVTKKKAGSVIRRKKTTMQKVAEEAAAVQQEALEAKAEQAVEPPVLVTDKEDTSVTEVKAAVSAPEVVKDSAPADEPVKEAAPVRPKRRNIVGKVDLSRVRPPVRRATSSAGDRSSVTRRPSTTGGASAPRSGFTAPAPPIGSAIGRKDARGGAASAAAKKKAAASTSEGSKEAPVATFAASEFRKREVIFQNKKRKMADPKDMKKTEITTPKSLKRIVKVNNSIKLSDLANEMGIKAQALVKVLMKDGVMANMNTDLEFDTVSLITPEFGWEAVNSFKSADECAAEEAFGDLDAELVTRAPVVTVMGHVDHGKTTLLDSIRKANVATGEAGGITQHIGAYGVTLDSGAFITFIDTPGHAAFTEMRARGANVTDIAIIVVAADDGIMPQSVEAINHAKAAGVPIIVAVNKIDRPNANIENVKKQLTEHELVPEEWGGETIFCPISALKGEGIVELLEQVHLVAEIQELKCNPKRSGTGVVIESKQMKGVGNVATLLVKDGTVKKGDTVVIGQVVAKIRRMMNDQGKVVQSAGPGVPVEVSGLPEVPNAGDTFDVCKDEVRAQHIADIRKEEQRKLESVLNVPSVEDLLSQVKGGQATDLSIVLKTDVAGSIEAIKGVFEKIDHPEVKVKVIHAAVGVITESDVLLAGTASQLVIGFNIKADAKAQSVAKDKNIEILTYGVIYELVDEIKRRLSGLLKPDIVEETIGRAEIREIFSVPKIGVIGGSTVTEGKFVRNCKVRVHRSGKVVFTGSLGSLKRFKDDVKEVANGFECGIGVQDYKDLAVGDEIEAYVQKEVQRTLDS